MSRKPERIDALRLYTRGEGWLFTARALYRTTDGGRSWRRIDTLPSRPAFGSRAVWFGGPSDAWVARLSSDDTSRVSVFATHDGGESWDRSTVDLGPGLDTGNPLRIFFLDADHGWLMATETTGSAFSSGRLFGTVDGGRTWSKLETPIAGAFEFITPRVGWMAGGPVGNQLFASRDGGRSWQHRALPPADVGPKTVATVALPRFWNETDGVLLVQRDEADADASSTDSSLTFFLTDDGGRSWVQTKKVVPMRCCHGVITHAGGRIGRFTVPDADVWYVMAERLLRSTDQGEQWDIVPSDEEDLINARTLDFADERHGWAYVENTECTRPKAQDCVHQTDLFATSDGGRTWREISPRSRPVAEG